MRLFLILILALSVLSCTNDDAKTNDILHQPPYNSLTDSIAKDPSNAGLYFRRGTLFFENEEKQLAAADLRKAWTLQPEEMTGLRLATILKNIHSDSAIVFLEEAVNVLPESIAFRISLARGYIQKGEKTKAQALVDQVLQQHPGQLDALSLKSELLNEQGNRGESLLFREKAYALVPSDPELAYDLAYEYAINKHPGILRLSDSLIRAGAPEIEKAYYTRGIYFSETGNLAEALKNFDAALKANYKFEDAYLDKGELLFNQKRYDDAQRNFELALRISPANADFYFWLARCQEARGFKDEAKVNYARAYGLDKTHTKAKEAAERL